MWPFGQGSRQPGAPVRAAASSPTTALDYDPPQRRRWSLTVLLAVSIGFIACVGLLAPLWDAYAQLIARPDGFGIAAICGGAIMAGLFVVLMLRELLSFMRLRRLEGLRLQRQRPHRMVREGARVDAAGMASGAVAGVRAEPRPYFRPSCASKASTSVNASGNDCPSS